MAYIHIRCPRQEKKEIQEHIHELKDSHQTFEVRQDKIEAKINDLSDNFDKFREEMIEELNHLTMSDLNFKCLTRKKYLNFKSSTCDRQKIKNIKRKVLF